MPIYEINEREVPLFPIRYVASIFGCTRNAILKKEDRGYLGKASFKNPHGQRLYSVEDLAVIEYVFKEIWPYRQGKKTPDWVKEIIAEALAQSKRLVIKYGKAESVDDWKELDKKYTAFNRHRLQIYIDAWRRRLIDCEKFYPELVDEDDDE